MKIVVIGSSGMVGSRIAAEAVARGHEVVGVNREGKDAPGVTAVAADAGDTRAIAGLAAEADALVSAVAPPRDGSPPVGPFLATAASIIGAARESGTSRLVWVGGAGSLEVGGNRRLQDTEGFPDAYKGEAAAQAEVLDVFRETTDLDWTYISPAAEIGPGERTGVFRTGGNFLLTDDAGHSRISAEDYAVAVVNELEENGHVRERMTVAY